MERLPQQVPSAQVPAVQLPPPFTRLQLALAAISNAEQLHEDARLLLKNGRNARAAVLSIVGIEECGKAICLIFMAIGYTPEEHAAKLFRLIGRDHRTKQAIGLFPRLLGIVFSRIRPALRAAAGKTHKPRRRFSDSKSLWAAVEIEVQRLVPTLVHAIELNSRDLPPIDSDMEAAMAGKWQDLRDRGLYVDFDEGELLTPPVVRRRDAAEAVRTLRAAVRGIRTFLVLEKLTSDSLEELRRLLPQANQLAEAQFSEKKAGDEPAAQSSERI
jgi:AbiV family abortive infection protein